MSDEREQLLATIIQLKRQLDESTALDPATVARLRATLADLDATLAGKTPPGQQTIGARLRQLTREFEASHPVLAGTVGSIIDALAGIGI